MPAKVASEYNYAGVLLYKDACDLSDHDVSAMLEYFRYWEVLRQCCGVQMSQDWRNTLDPLEGYTDHHGPHDLGNPHCMLYNITEVEATFRETVLYRQMQKYSSLRSML